MGSVTIGGTNKTNYKSLEIEILNKTLDINGYSNIEELISHLKDLLENLNITNVSWGKENCSVDDIEKKIRHFIVKYNELYNGSSIDLDSDNDIFQNYNTISESIIGNQLTRNYGIRQSVIMTILNNTKNGAKKYETSNENNPTIFKNVLSKIKKIF